MAVEDLLIKTGIDELIKLLKEKRKVELSQASKTLGYPEDSIKEWASILEEEGIIEISYGITKTYLVWKGLSNEKARKKQKEIISSASTLEDEINSEKDSVEKSLDDIRSRKSVLEKTLKRIEELENKHASELAERDLSRKEMLEKINDVGQSISSLKQSVSSVMGEVEKIRNVLKKSGADVLGDLGGIKRIRDELKSLDSEIDSLEKKAAGTMKALPSGSLNLPEIRKKLEFLEKRFRSVIADVEALKEKAFSTAEIRKLVKKAQINIEEKEKKLSEMLSKVEEMKKVIGGMTEEIVNLSTEILTIRGEIEDARAAMGVLKGYTPSSLGITAVDISKIEEKEADLKNTMEDLKKSFESAKKVEELVEEFRKISSEIDKKRAKFSKEVEELFSKAEEEGRAYRILMKMRERASNELKEQAVRLEKIREQAEKLESEFKKKLSVSSPAPSSSEISELKSLLDDLKGRKKEISNLLERSRYLEERFSTLSRKLALLKKQAEILRESSEEESEKEKKHIDEELKLASKDKEEYEKKRKELIDMIERLWEEEENKKK